LFFFIYDVNMKQKKKGSANYYLQSKYSPCARVGMQVEGTGRSARKAEATRRTFTKGHSQLKWQPLGCQAQRRKACGQAGHGLGAYIVWKE